MYGSRLQANEAPGLSAALPQAIHEIGRGANAARDLDEPSARALFGAMLDGAIPPLELGAVLMAYRIKGESAGELRGFMAALHERAIPLLASPDRPRPVVLPSYNGARRLPNLTALLALVLRRDGIPVLVHGPADAASDDARVTSRAILGELGIDAATSIDDVYRRLHADGLAYAPVEMLAPGLAALLALRRRLGVRSSAHTVAKLIDPFGGDGVRVVAVTHPHYLTRMREHLAATRADALLLRGTEGEPFANPRRQPQLECFRAGRCSVVLESAVAAATQALPAIDAASTAAWIGAVLQGTEPIPAPIAHQAACCRKAAQRASTAAVA